MTTPPASDDEQVVAAIIAAAADGRDFAGWLAAVLARAAARLGSTSALLASRPGSWEAMHVRNLLAGTVGESDEHLSGYREESSGG